nr:reverse transcriptase domain-containing protein [Tanacetum cinerariifolium]
SNPKRRNRRHSKQPFILKESPVDTIADQRTMAKLLRAPTKGYAEAIVVPPILAEQFELKHSLINMMNSDQFFGLEKDNPHDHIRCGNFLLVVGTFYWQWEHITGSGKNALEVGIDRTFNSQQSSPKLDVASAINTTSSSSSSNHLLDEFTDELPLITFPPGNDDLTFDIKSDLKEIEYLLHHDPIKDIDSILEDLVDQSNLADLNDNLVDTMPEMFTEEHALDYSSPLLYDEYDDDLFKVESDTKYVYDDPFDSKGEKIKESKLLIDELDLPSDFFLLSSMTRFSLRIFPRLMLFPQPTKRTRYLTQELPCFKEVSRSKILLSFSSENEEKVFKPGILTSKEVYSSLILELSHRGYKVFKISQILKSPMEIFLFSCGEDLHILDVPCLYFYPP